ncbi:carbohydrate ABC transporter permease [Actinopolymorpha alba]|uniref:carbohydrate ABC transporter permease n=1 Tax=Actinopolymorpha alba TaxID=533267 RepID=UPI00035C9F35|nr:sugar ABC transporter permease [Actinopolymorpha alba]
MTSAALEQEIPAAGGGRAPWTTRLWHSGVLFVVPFLLVFAIFLVWPIISGFVMGFTDASLNGRPASFVGFGNYVEAFGDPEVWRTLWHTVLFTLITTLPMVVIPLGAALLTNLGFPGQWLYRMSFFAPFLLPVTVVTIFWGWMYHADFGLLNAAMEAIGLDRVPWLQDERYAMLSVAVTTVWWTLGFNYLLYLAALQDIPQHLYEAAAIDGAGAWRSMWSITLPMLGRITGLIAVLQLIASLKVFDQIYLLTRGGPNGSTRPVLLYVYDVGFSGFRLGYAAAISYLVFAVIVILSLGQLKLFSRGSD